MPWRNWNNDEELLLDIGEALCPEPLEAEVLAAARHVPAWRTAAPDTALATLLYDSELDRMPTVSGPRPGSPRGLVFVFGELRVEVKLGRAGIDGQLVPPAPGRIQLFGEAGPIAETLADDIGRFTFPAGHWGPIRIGCTVAGRHVTTGWIAV
jgi:hypothetical protein